MPTTPDFPALLAALAQAIAALPPDGASSQPLDVQRQYSRLVIALSALPSSAQRLKLLYQSEGT